MNEKKRDFFTCLLMGAAAAIAVCVLNVSRDFGFARSVCDGLFVAAVLLLGMGGIKAARNKGTFDVAGFGLRRAAELVIPMLRRDEKEDIYQYRDRKARERKSSVGMLLAGAVYLVLSLVALVVYYAIPR